MITRILLVMDNVFESKTTFLLLSIISSLQNTWQVFTTSRHISSLWNRCNYRWQSINVGNWKKFYEKEWSQSSLLRARFWTSSRVLNICRYPSHVWRNASIIPNAGAVMHWVFKYNVRQCIAISDEEAFHHYMCFIAHITYITMIIVSCS